ncbi:hypothetical protein GCM10009801_73480 [Streptomyces albiaxialis]|uniref:SnoaL-like domain-containing protein n=1 Tax=Streptomyces albiaxialis TaxID=329523 RepID=A0ABP5IIE0_9ACTN
MPDEATRKHMVHEYARRINDGDVEGLLALFTDDVVFEDPVGARPLRGRSELRERIAEAVAGGVHETPGRVVTSMDERWVVVPSTITVEEPTRMTFHVIGIMEVGEDGLSRHVQAFWGMTDTHVGDGPRPAGVEQYAEVAQQLTEMGRAARERTESA